MIQPNELRRNNLIMYGNMMYPVDRITESTISVRLSSNSLRTGRPHEFEPVPLSPDILEACGFEKDGFNAFNICISPWPESHLKQLSFSGDYLYLREGELEKNRITDSLCVLWNNDLRGKMNLHQFQNLFFALTGSELSVNLEKVAT